MKTTTKKLSDTRVEVRVTLEASDLKAAREKALVRLAANLKVQGFRQGKAPVELVEKHVSENEISSETIDLAVRTSVPEAFKQAKLAPIAVENVNVEKYVPGESAEYVATAEILPDIKLGKFKGLKAKMPNTEPTDAEVQEVLDNIAQAYSEKIVVKRAAKKGDEVIIDFVGKKDGEPFRGGSAKDYRIILGSGQFIPGFEDGIVGHESGDKFDLDLTFPENYHEKSLAGEKTVFEVLLKQVNEVQKPKEDDALAQKCGDFKTIDELKTDIRNNLETQNRHRAMEQYREDLVAELVKASEVVAPEILIKDQLRLINDDVRRNAASAGMQVEDYIERLGKKYSEWEEEARKVAEERVKASLVLQVLAREQKIEAANEEVDAKINELKDLYRKSKEAIASLKRPEVRQDIKNRLTIDKTLEFLISENEEKPTDKAKSTKSGKSETKKKADKKADQ